MTTYTIKQVSQMFGLPASTLRYYEEIGLLPVSYTHLTLPTTPYV